MAKHPREHRVPIMMSKKELATVDDWRFRNRVATRSDAIRRLCQIGLLIDDYLESMVDNADDILMSAFRYLDESIKDYQLIAGREVSEDRTFSMNEVRDILHSNDTKIETLLDALEEHYTMIVTIYNAKESFIENKQMDIAGIRASNKLATGKEFLERIYEKRRTISENRYLSLVIMSKSAQEQADYDAMTEVQKDEYLERRMAELEDEERADPEKFSIRYGLQPFWRRSPTEEVKT